MNTATTSAPAGPLARPVRRLMDFLTGRCALSEAAAAECLSAFLAAKTADQTFHQQAPRETAPLGEFLEKSLREFAKSWLAEKQARLPNESCDALGFARTIWTDLRVANAPDDEMRLHALERLLRKYLPALKAYLRSSLKRKFSFTEEWIEDCAQGFVLEKILEKELIAKADKARGRFRDLLKRSLYNFAIGNLRKEKPWLFGPLPAPEEGGPEPAVPPANAAHQSDVEWARGVLAEALRRTKAECTAKGRPVVWAVFERRRLKPLLTSARPEPLEETVRSVRESFGTDLAIQKVCELQVAGDRKFRRFVSDVLSEYCRDAEEIEEESRRLMEILQQTIGDQDPAELEAGLARLLTALGAPPKRGTAHPARP